MHPCTPTSEEKEEEARCHLMTDEIQSLSRKLVLLKENFQSDHARDFLSYGVMRRLSIIRLNLKTIFKIAYCGRRQMLDFDNESDLLDMHIHSFFYHCYGALDNAAWCIAHERNYPLLKNKLAIGLFKQKFSGLLEDHYPLLWNVLKHQKKHYDDMTEIRDAIAHRKPLYVPPGVLNGNRIMPLTQADREPIFKPVFCVEGDPLAFFPIKEYSLIATEHLLAIMNAFRQELEISING